MTEKVQKARLRSLKKLCTDYDGATKLAKALGFKGPSYISQMIGGHREVSEKTAAFIENKLKLEPGWMGQDHRKDAALSNEFKAIDLILKSVLQAVEESGRTLPNAKFAEVIRLSSKHFEKSGTLDPEYLQDLVKLAVE